MEDIHVCKACNYETSDKSNYTGHIKSLNHKWLQEYLDLMGYPLNTEPPIDSDIILNDNNFYCNHCNKVLSKKYKSVHFKLCSQLKQALEDAKNKINKLHYEKEINDLNNKLVISQKDAEIDKMKLQLEVKDLKLEINTLKNSGINGNENNVHSHNTTNNTDANKSYNKNSNNKNSNNKNKSISLVYIKNNYTNAPVYEDIMAKELTAEEKKAIEDLSPMTACTKLITQRCIENVDMDKRPFHCLDIARHKLAARIKNKHGEPKWKVDLGGEHILKCAISRIKSNYPIKGDDIDIVIKNQQALQEIMTPSNKRKMLREVSRISHVDASNTL